MNDEQMKQFADEFTPIIESAISTTKRSILKKVLKESSTYEEAFNKLHIMSSYYVTLDNQYPYFVGSLMSKIFDQLQDNLKHKALSNKINQEQD